MSDPKINVSLKLDGAKPWVTVYGDNAQELAAHLDSIAANGIGAKAAAALESLKAGFEVGAQLGGQQVASQPVAPQQPYSPPQQPQYAAPAQQAPQQWQQPQQSAEPPWAAAQPPVAPAAPAAPAGYGAPAAPAADPGQVQGPFIPAFGMSATFRDGVSTRGPWKAWMDPRPKAVTDSLVKGPDGKVATTNDPNDPRLAQGTAKFTQWIR